MSNIKKLVIIIIAFILIWTAVFITDTVRTLRREPPLFCISFANYDIDTGYIKYTGLFYKVERFLHDDTDERTYLMSAWFYDTSKQRAKNINPSPDNVAVQTENSGIYKSEKYGYSVSYPEDKYIVRNSEGYDYFIYNENDTSLPEVFLAVSAVPKEYAHTVTEAFTDGTDGEFKKCVIGADELNAKIGQQTEKWDKGYIYNKKYYAYLKDGSVMIIETRSYSIGDKDNYADDLEKILSTLKIN